MRRALMVALLLLVPALAHAQPNPPSLSLHRLSAGLDAKGVLEGSGEGDFAGGGYLSMSVTSALSLAAVGDWIPKDERCVGRLGTRFLLARMGDGQIGAALNWKVEPGKAPRFGAGANGSWTLATKRSGAALLYGIAGAEFCPETEHETELTTVWAGLRWQLAGGKPWVPPSITP